MSGWCGTACSPSTTVVKETAYWWASKQWHTDSKRGKRGPSRKEAGPRSHGCDLGERAEGELADMRLALAMAQETHAVRLEGVGEVGEPGGIREGRAPKDGKAPMEGDGELAVVGSVERLPTGHG